MGNLYIAEKPSMARDIAAALGDLNKTTPVQKDGYLQVGQDVVTNAFGHIVRLADAEEYNNPAWSGFWKVDNLPMIPEKFLLKAGRDGDRGKKGGIQSHLDMIGRLLKQCSCVVNAGDAAREGQLIVEEILQLLGYKGAVKRLWLQEMNRAYIMSAIGRMKNNSEYQGLTDSSFCRAHTDWILGINMTRAFTVTYKNKFRDFKGVLNVGRVKTPTICMIAERDIEIENFVPTDYFVIKAPVTPISNSGTFTATLDIADAIKNGLIDSSSLDSQNRLCIYNKAKEISDALSKSTGIVAEYETKPVAVNQPLTFSLGDLQKTCFKQLGMTPDETLKCAQELYETYKVASYPRTDYSHLPESEHKDAPQIIAAIQANMGSDFPAVKLDMSIVSSTWNSKKIGDHHGIRPTGHKNKDCANMSPQLKAVFHIICKQFIAQFLPKYEYDSTIVKVVSKGFGLKAQGKTERIIGWKVLFGKEEGAEEEAALPAMSQGEPVRLGEVKPEAKKTSPPARFDAASLLEAMEKAHLFMKDETLKASMKNASGIGTPATRAKLIEDLIKGDFIKIMGKGKKTNYISTEKGRMMYYAAPEELKYPDLTAYIESLLSDIEQKQNTYDGVMAEVTRLLNKMIDNVKSGYTASTMKSLDEIVVVEKVKKTGTGSGDYRSRLAPAQARANEKKTAGASKASKSNTAQQGGKYVCSACGKPMKQREGSKGPFLGCTGFPICRTTMQIPNGMSVAQAKAMQEKKPAPAAPSYSSANAFSMDDDPFNPFSSGSGSKPSSPGSAPGKATAPARPVVQNIDPFAMD